MIELSPNAINRTASYSVIPVGTMAFRFITEKSLVYEVGFVEDYSFLEENAYLFYLKEITGSSAPTDIKIMLTVGAIIEEFFAKNQSVMLYICDTSDGRQAARDRKFLGWFENAENKKKYTLLHCTAKFDGVGYFTAILIKNDNPDLEDIKKAYDDYKQQIKDKFPDVTIQA